MRGALLLSALGFALLSCEPGQQRVGVLAGELPASTAASIEWRAPWVPELLGLGAEERVRGFDGEGLRLLRLVGEDARPEGFSPGVGFRSLGSRRWFQRSVQQLDSAEDFQVELHADLGRSLVPMLNQLFQASEGGWGSKLSTSFLGLESFLSAAVALRLERLGDRVESVQADVYVQLAREPMGLVKALLLPAAKSRLGGAAQELPGRFAFLWARADLQRILSQQRRSLARQGGYFGEALRQVLGASLETLPFLREELLEALGDEYLCFWPRLGNPLDPAQSQLVVTVADPRALREAISRMEFDGFDGLVKQGSQKWEARLRLQGRSVGLVLEFGERSRLRLGPLAAVRKALPKAATRRNLLAKPSESLALFDLPLPAIGTVIRGGPKPMRPLLTGRARCSGSLSEQAGRMRLRLATHR
ncbi:MAG: hypothetical protein CSA62_07545 [Planctomycetota bacterium]|nr:MAG: hypothetical protein CSA62_07545 [Planctomycetota bacterium]